MTEATPHNLLGRPIFLLVFLTYILFPCFTYSQSIQSGTRHSQLLDSGEVLKLKNQWDQSIALHESIVDESKTEGDWEVLAHVYNELADLYRGKNNLELAQQYLNHSQKIISSHLSDSSVEFSRNIYYRGKIFLTKSDYPKDSAINEYKKAIDSHEKVNIKDHSFLSDVYYSLGEVYASVDNLGLSVQYYKQLEKLLLYEFDAGDYKKGYYLFYLALQYYHIADYERSIILTELATYLFMNSKAYHLNMYRECKYLLANNYFESQHYENSIQEYEEIIKLVKSEIDENDSYLLYMYINICQPLLNIEDYDQVIYYSNEAMKLIRIYPDLKRFLYYLSNNLAESYGKQGNDINAEKYFRLSIDQRIELFGSRNEQVYEGYRYFGEYQSQKSDHNMALELYNKSLMALYEEFEPADIYDNPDFEGYENIEQLLYVVFDKARSLYHLYAGNADLKALHTSFALYAKSYIFLDGLLEKNYLDKSFIQLFKRFEKDFDLSVNCAIALYEITADQSYLEQAFQFVEKNRYILLYKAMVNSSKKTSDNIEEGMLSALSDELRQQIGTVQNYDTLFLLRNRLARILVQKDELSLQSDNLDKLSIDADKKPFSLEDAQSLVRNSNEILVEFHWSEHLIHVFLIGKDFTDVVKIEWNQELMDNLMIYSRLVSTYSDNWEDFINYVISARHLYATIFSPLEEKLIHTDSINRITIIPDGPLSSISFDAFLTEIDTTTLSYWSPNYLCKKYTFSYAYSLNILEKNLEEKEFATQPSMLALSYSNILERDSDIEQLRSENELPYSGEEIKRIRKQISAKSYLGKRATEDVFKAKAGDYTLIHLALHGQADTIDMFNSKLIFKKDPKGNEDGELHAYELYSLDLDNLEMVVLSACETGIGTQYEGEGIFSIARGFAYAGCPSIVMSLWKVNDKATAKLMDNYYKNLSDGLDKDEALRQAKLAYISTGGDLGAHPSNWAAFINLGNNKAIHIPETTSYWYYVALAFLVFGTVYWWSRRKKYSSAHAA